MPESITQARVQRFFLAWLVFRRNPIAMSGFLIILSLVLRAIFAPWITATNGLEPQLADRLQPASAEHWFGTDGLGRDLFDRIIWGSRITLYIVAPVGVIVVTKKEISGQEIASSRMSGAAAMVSPADTV